MKKTLFLAALPGLLSACAATGPMTASAPAAVAAGDAPAPAPAQATDAAATAHPDQWPSPRWPIARDAATEARIKAMVARMTVEEKVGQILQADISSVTPADVKRYHLGSVLNGGNSAPGGDEFAPAPKWLALADALYDASVDASDGGVAIPVIWGTDAVHGHSNIVGATLFPHNIGLGAMRDPALIEKIGAATAIEIRTTGMEWTFAPTVTVPQDYRWGRSYEGYSSDPALVSSYVGAMIRGLQGDPSAGPILKGPHVIASTKHYLADGGTDEGRDQGDAKIDEATLRDIHGAPYVPAIEQGVATVMTSFSSWNGVKIAGNRSLVTDLLKDHMGFDGFVVTDWNAHGQIAGCTNASCPQAINAGIDMYMAPDSWKDLYASLTAQVKDGTVPMARLDDAVSRILRVKMRLGMFDAGRPSARPLAGKFDLLGSAEHRRLAREAVQKSLVLLKNAGNVLPLKPGAKILVAGDAANDIGRQSGGWTLTWQGTGMGNDKFPGATSIWAGIRDAAKAAGGSATLAPDGRFAAKPDAAIVVFGETPYAEFQGDRKTLLLAPDLKDGPLATMKRLKAAGIPVVAVMVTGRPLFMNAELNAADAFVSAWLPGSEGGGVADGLFGKSRFTGKLPTAWPATAQAKGAVLFPFGYGLDATAKVAAWTPLSEDPGVEQAASEGVYFEKGVPASSWSLQVLSSGQDMTRITTVPADALAGKVRVTAVDYGQQEGARQFALKGGLPQTVALTTFNPVDVSRQTNGDVLLLVTMRIDARPTGPVLITEHSGSTVASVPAPEIAGLPVGEWRTVAVPLKCFAKAGADMTKIDVPFALTTPGAMTFSLGRVALGTVADTTVACPTR